MTEYELKPCPFCGGTVFFEKDFPYEIYQGKCENCTMEFRYEHKEEELTDSYMNGEIKVTYTYLRNKQLNLPFTDAWDRRV